MPSENPTHKRKRGFRATLYRARLGALRAVFGQVGGLLGLAEPEPTPEQVASGEKLSRRDRRHRDLVRFIQERGVPAGLKTLDVGCAPGLLSERLFEAGYSDVKGCDWAAEADLTERAREIVEYQKVDLNTDALSAYPDQGFGLVVCSDVLEHLENPTRMFREFERVLAPGGHVFFSVPNAFNLIERWRLLRSGNSGRYRSERRAQPFGHISMLPGEVIESLGDRAGLEVRAQGKGYVWWRGYFLLPGRVTSPLFSYVATYHLQRHGE
ncbi:MAG: class I SAM-dependent methyltransferase [Bacteroidota bacterium]